MFSTANCNRALTDRHQNGTWLVQSEIYQNSPASLAGFFVGKIHKMVDEPAPKSKTLLMFEKTFEQLMSFSEGGQVTSISFDDRSAGYSTAKYDDLLKMYNRLRPQLLKSGEITEDEYPDMAQTIGRPLTAVFCN